MLRNLNKLAFQAKQLDSAWTKSISSVQSINISDVHVMLKKTCKEFSDKEIIPLAGKIDKTHEFPKEIVKKMGELGLMGIDIPEKYNGAGLDYTAYVIAMEEISRGCASCGVIMSAHTVLYSKINHFIP
jgi:butyryl-CoA dehydrogenase